MSNQLTEHDKLLYDWINFEKAVTTIAEKNNVTTLTKQDKQSLHKQLTKIIVDLDKAKKGLMNETVDVDPRGRIVIPGKLRTLLNMKPGSRVEVFPYPQQNPKGLFLKKAR